METLKPSISRLRQRMRQQNLATARALLDVPRPEPVDNESAVTLPPTFVCRCCGAAMLVVEIIVRRQPIRAPP